MTDRTGRSPPRAGAGWLARREPLPTALRAVLRYYARTGAADLGALALRRRVDSEVEALVREAFDAVESALAAELGASSVAFGYDTKLTLPVELTLGYLYRRSDEEATAERAREVAALVAEALLDGDMRDAINDQEYGDFRITVEGANNPEPARVAEVAQATLRERVEDRFDEYPEGVRPAYEQAVEVSERHQAQDPRFRELMAAAREGDEDAIGRIEREYRDAAFDTGEAGTDPSVLGPDERALPYCRTQYERVGVIYHGMIEMFREAGLAVDEPFERSIVLAIVGAQVWLDDVDDFAADMADGQLTPVTAEYLIAADDRAAYERVVEVATAYLDAAVEYAAESDSTLTGIATEYIYLSGDPQSLPGSE